MNINTFSLLFAGMNLSSRVWWVVLLLAIPALALGIIPFVRLNKKRRASSKHLIPFIIHMIVVILLSVVVAGVSWTTTYTESNGKVVMFVVDMSDSNAPTSEEMNEYMIRKWNAKVRVNDETVILGDFAFADGKTVNELLRKLNGRKYLIRGNHDSYFLDDREFDTSLFYWIKDYAEMKDNRRTVVLCHYPIMCYNGQYRTDEEGNPKRYMLYGHVHNTYDEKLVNEMIMRTRNSELTGRDGQKFNIPCNLINCFCMFSDYEPLSLDEWIETDRKRRETLTQQKEPE
jgi:calcineurin-like phosphoesterase family protein